MKWTVSSKTNLGIGVAFAVMLGIGLASYYNAYVLLDTTHQVASNYRAEVQLEAYLSILRDAEDASQAYLITGDEQQLANYSNAESRLDERLRTLRQLTANDAQLQRWLDGLAPLVAVRLADLKQSVELKKSKKSDVDSQILLAQKGRKDMDVVLRVTREMEAEANDALTLEVQGAEGSTRRTAVIFALGTLGGLGLCLLVFYILNVEVNERKRAENEIQKLNEELGWRVIERTTELKKSNRELQNQIVERRRMEEALKKSEASYRSLIMGAAYGIFRCSVEGKFLAVNPALVAMLGYESEAELLRMNLLHDVFRDPMEGSQLLQQYRQMGRLDGLEAEWKGRGNAPVAVRLSGRAVLNDAGALEGFELIAENVSERKRLEEQFRQAQKMEAVGRLAGGVAHDFNNLLTIIIGYSQLLYESLEPDSASRGPVEEIKKAGERAAALTRQLLAFSRRQVLQPQILDLNAVVTNIEKMLRRLIGEDVELVMKLAPDLGRVRADPGQIEQVVMNLAVNARDAMPKGGTLILSTANVELDQAYVRRYILATPGPHIMLSVSDTGVGMDAETQSHIFEPFFTTKEKGKGTGLGLATVYGIVKQSGGNIWVYSEPGRGTTFKVYFPRVDEVAPKADTRAVTSTGRRGSETVLVVEDDQAVRPLVLGVLRSNGYKVLEAGRGEEAVVTSQRHEGPIHLLVTDVVMPGMSGKELAERLVTLYPQMKVLYMSGYTDGSIFHHGVLDPEAAFLQKPFTAEALARKVREVLDAVPNRPA